MKEDEVFFLPEIEVRYQSFRRSESLSVHVFHVFQLVNTRRMFDASSVYFTAVRDELGLTSDEYDLWTRSFSVFKVLHLQLPKRTEQNVNMKTPVKLVHPAGSEPGS